MARRDIEKDFAALEHVRRARFTFETRICEASEIRTPSVLETLRLDSMYEFAEFFFTMEAMDLKSAGDVSVLADAHDRRIIALMGDQMALRRRRLRRESLLDSIFSSDVRPRLEAIWSAEPGSLDQSNLARFLVTQMSAETTRNLVVAASAAGFLTRFRHPLNVFVVRSTGVMEQVFADCLRDLRLAIAAMEE